MPTGKIKYYNQDKGYGFIAQDEGEDLFFHILKNPSLGEIKAGQNVKYEITRGKKGLEAENIQLILTPFEQRKLSQGRVIVSRDTMVWTPATDVRSKTRQPERQPFVQRDRPKTRPVPSKPSPKPSVSKEVKKKPSRIGKEGPAPKKEAPKVSNKESAPLQKPIVKAPPVEEKKKPEQIKQTEKTKQKVEPKEPVSQETQKAPPPKEKSQRKPQQKRKLTYGDRYILKQIRETTPMVFEMYNHESIFCTVDKLLKYDLELFIDGKEKIQIQKHNIKYCYKQENAEHVKASISFDENVRSQGLTPLIPRKERYQIDHNMVKETRVKRQKVRLVTREGEIIMGQLDWFSTYEVKVRLPPGGNVIVFFHALYDFKVLSDEEASSPKESSRDSLGTVGDEEKVSEREPETEVAHPASVEEVSTPIRTSTEEIPLGEKIHIARNALDMSQKEIAESLGVSIQTIRNWEKGKNQPQAKYQEQIEQFLATAQNKRN